MAQTSLASSAAPKTAPTSISSPTATSAAMPKSGQPNLYVWHGTAAGSGTVTYIDTLRAPTREEEKHIEAMRAGAFEYHSDVADWTSRPTESQAYVTPDGRHLAFMSVEPLTGYDNEDQAIAVADHEVFEYSAESGRLACASCDAGDVRPLGSAFIGAKLGERVSTPFHQPRSLSDDGSRLFFSSPDPLVPGISGASVRVFEYEDGAVQLISGTESGGTAVFLDASTSGNDVFFATREQLVPADVDELVDVYDARVGGGLAQALALMPCQGGACREPLIPPPSFSTAASASFTGVGNLAPAAPAKSTRAQLLSRALALCKKLRSKKRRSACSTPSRTDATRPSSSGLAAAPCRSAAGREGEQSVPPARRRRLAPDRAGRASRVANDRLVCSRRDRSCPRDGCAREPALEHRLRIPADLLQGGRHLRRLRARRPQRRCSTHGAGDCRDRDRRPAVRGDRDERLGPRRSGQRQRATQI